VESSNNNIGKNFFDVPKPHHHVSRLLVLSIILAIILAVAWLSVYLFNKQEPAPAVVQTVDNNPAVVLTDEEWATKQEKMKAVAEENNKPVTLTKEQIAEKEAKIQAAAAGQN
jgi:hypothetical protein